MSSLEGQTTEVEAFLSGVINISPAVLNAPTVLERWRSPPIFEITDGQLAMDRLERALNFDIGIVRRRYVEEYGVSDAEAAEHELELKRFLVLCAGSERGFAIVAPIDYFWHSFIVFTRLYARFCEVVADRYIHHSPVEESGATESEQLASYLSMLDAYAQTFGIEAPAHIWPRIEPGVGMLMHPCTNCS